MSITEVPQGRLRTPFYSRLAELDTLNKWHEWKGYTAADALYCAETEYFAIRNATSGASEFDFILDNFMVEVLGSNAVVATPGDTNGDGAGGVWHIVPYVQAFADLFDNTTVLEPVLQEDTGSALVTHLADRARDRHHREGQFMAYDHYLSFYWEHRTAAVEIVDPIGRGGDTITFNVTTQWPLSPIEAELDAAQASKDLRNRCLYPLQTLKRQIEKQASIAHINQAQQNAIEVADEAFDKIEAASKPKETPGVGEKKPPVYVKKRRVVQAARLAPRGFLETQIDVDDYLDKLRQALESAINNDERVEIR